MKKKISEKITIKSVMVLLLIIYLVPTFINYDFNTENRFTGAKISLPYLYAGDQIHYYILLYSLLKDKDFDIRNNYDNSEFNLTYDIGYLFRGQHLLRYARYFNFKTWDQKPAWVENTSENIGIYGEIEVFEGTSSFEVPDPGEDYGMFMIKSLGLPLFYYVLLLPFNFVPNPEPLVIFLTVFLVLLGVYFFYLTIDHFLKDEKTSALFTLLMATSSTLWFYSKLFYPDVLQFSLLSLMVYLFIVKDDNLFVGMLFAIGIFSKPTFGVFLPFFIIYRFFRLEKYTSFSQINWNISKLINFEGIKKMLLLLFPAFLIFVIQLYLDYYLFGSFSSNSQWGSLIFRDIFNIFEGLFVSFFKLNRGFFIFSPVLLFAFFGLRSFYRKHKIDSIFIYMLPLSLILLCSLTLVGWNRGLDAYAIRFYVVIMPYFYIPMAFWYKDVTHTKKTREKNKIWLNIFYIALVASILINFQAAIFHTLIWCSPPWKIICLLIENWGQIFLKFF